MSAPLAAVLAVSAAAWQRFIEGRSLDQAIGSALQSLRGAAAAVPADALRAATRDVLFTAVRERALLEAIVRSWASRPPTAPVSALLIVAMSQLRAQRHAAFVVVDQAVEAARRDTETAASAHFINALLRRYGREGDAIANALNADLCVRANMPAWWLARLQSDWPQHWPQIVAAQTAERSAPPMVLRVNRRRSTVVAYLDALAARGVAASQIGTDAVWLHKAMPVDALFGFTEGVVSVQDAGSQLAAQLLDAQPGHHILDAGAAPGGKTMHLIERTDVTVDAVERDEERARRIHENLARVTKGDQALSATVRVVIADAADPADLGSALKGLPHYERILLDAPCSASGIVRRHPDIAWLRRPEDVVNLATSQRRMLEGLWPLLVPAGRLLYVVCSLFAEEGVAQIAAFLGRHADARLMALPGIGQPCLQLLPRATVSMSVMMDRMALSVVTADLSLPAQSPQEPLVCSGSIVSAWAGQADVLSLRPSVEQSSAAFNGDCPLPSFHDGYFYALLTKTPPPH